MGNNFFPFHKLIKLTSILFFAAVIAISHLAFSTATSAQDASKRFDFLVREDIFAGLAGDRARFDKAMKLCEETLAKNPKHAEAMVWHGGGVFTRAGWAFQAGDMRKGGELWRKGLDEMNAAVALEPDNIGVLIPRAAVLLESVEACAPACGGERIARNGCQRLRKSLEASATLFRQTFNARAR